MKSWIKDPFLHFIFLGLLLFGFHAVWVRQQSPEKVLTVTSAEMDRQTLIFTGENRRPPSDVEQESLRKDFIKEEILVREARARGLDEGDSIVRQRLVQKMEFLLNDVAVLPDPAEEDLRSWFEDHKAKFGTPEKISFTHIYMSPEAHGDTLQADAEALLKLVQETPNLDPLTLGDPFMLQKQFRNVTERNIAGLFGKNFTTGLFSQENPETPPVWVGIVPSAVGLHIVRIDDRIAAQTLKFEDIKISVETAWRSQAMATANKDAVDALVSTYSVRSESLK